MHIFHTRISIYIHKNIIHIQIYTRTHARKPKRALLPAKTFFLIEAKQPCHTLKSPTAYQKIPVAYHKSLHHTASHCNAPLPTKPALYIEVQQFCHTLKRHI